VRRIRQLLGHFLVRMAYWVLPLWGISIAIDREDTYLSLVGLFVSTCATICVFDYFFRRSEDEVMEFATRVTQAALTNVMSTAYGEHTGGSEGRRDSHH